mgnify:CR=1 FL=1
MSKAKYVPGPVIDDLTTLEKQEFVFVHHKVTHRGWFLSWSIRTALIFLDARAIRYALKKEEEDDY